MKRLIFLGALGASACFSATAAAQFPLRFDNLQSFAGLGGVNGTAAGGITPLRAAKVNFLAGSAGETINAITFSVANFNTTTQSVRARIRFYDTTGAGGGPGTYLSGYSFNAFSFGVGVTNLTGTIGPGFLVPAAETLWAGITFDNVGTTTAATNTELNNFGVGLFNLPASVGSMTNQTFVTSTAGSFLVNNPAGTLGNWATNINAGWRFQTSAVPEPASMAALGIGLAGLVARRRKKS